MSDAGMSEITVLLVDDHDVMRAGLAMLLTDVLGAQTRQARDADEARQIVNDEPIDLVLLDVRLGPASGIDLLVELRAAHPDLPVLMLSTYDGPADVEPALDAGAAGYVLKEATPAQLGEAMQTAMSGRGVYLSPPVAARLLERRQTADANAATGLSTRELQILELLTEGATNDEIAAALIISVKTVKTHLSGLFRKLGVTNRTQAAAAALRDQMITPGGNAAG